jgi:hypothetical protein
MDNFGRNMQRINKCQLLITLEGLNNPYILLININCIEIEITSLPSKLELKT